MTTTQEYASRTRRSANGQYDLALDEHGQEVRESDSVLVMTGDYSTRWVHISLTDED